MILILNVFTNTVCTTPHTTIVYSHYVAHRTYKVYSYTYIFVENSLFWDKGTKMAAPVNPKQNHLLDALLIGEFER